MNEQLTQLQQQMQLLKREIDDLRYILHKKIGGGSADIKGNLVNPSTVNATIAADSVTQAMIAAAAVGQSEVKTELATVTISAGQPSGTATVTSGNIILGWYPTTNLDQIIDDISISGTTLTVTLAGNATATTTIKVQMLKA